MDTGAKPKPKIVSLFSGCGGLDLGFHMEGYDTVWANDFSEWACASFGQNFGEVIHFGDITKINPYEDTSIPECDLVLGGALPRFFCNMETARFGRKKRRFIQTFSRVC